MISEQYKLELLQQILSSPDFKSSKSSAKLLEYLVKANIENKSVKEYSIAIEILGKSTDFNPLNDSSVRVYISNLRKKVDKFYRTVGKNSKYRISIPKGSYDVEFVKITDEFAYSNEHKKKSFQTVSYLVLILLIAVAFFKDEIFNPKTKNSFENPFYSDMINNKLPKLIVVGNDLFFLKNKRVNQNQSFKDEEIVRKHYINSESDFLKLQSEHPETRYSEITRYPFFPLSSISPLIYIKDFFGYNHTYNLTYSQKLTATDLLENDIVFFGTIRNLGLLNKIVLDGISYNIAEGNTYFKITTADTTLVYRFSGRAIAEHKDYCLIRKIPGPNNNSILLFITFFETAMEGATKFFLDEISVNELAQLFEKKYGEVPQYFDVVIKVSGYSRTAFSTSIDFISKITPNEINVW